MRLNRLGEFGLIEEIRRTATVGKGVRIGIGDDCAWVDHLSRSSLITADLLIESIHFDLKWTSLDALGYKSLAVNLSDIAAMGGVPRYAIISLGIPGNFDSKQITEFYRGFHRLARRCGVVLIGGDTNIAKSLIVSVCVIGDPPARPVRRRGAKVGDDIYVTGTLGDSALGLALLRKQLPVSKRGAVAQLLARHHRPTPRLTAGALLARRKLATAMIDISDGLLQDLAHICRASGTGAMIWSERLPLSRAYIALAGKAGERPALNGGEDYELLFCARQRQRERIEKLSASAQTRITRIGRCVTAALGITVLDSSGRPLFMPAKGYDHFKK
ncbi:MAG TPA: thiamine-phosphate kinase [Candidatus Limnocylindrales bacterium]|nr:thiamine-phosphate kinase [Candidatus Limnocylindrales bacterium]